MKPSLLLGIRSSDWWRLLRENGFSIDLDRTPHALLLSLLAVTNSLQARRTERIDLADVQVEPPLFILGHWRSGTTLLHYLLAEDPALAAPSTYDCVFPHSCITRDWRAGWLRAVAPRSRPQDRMAFDLDTPQEDELALGVLALRSPYLGWMFPRARERYRRYLTFESATPDERAAFASALVRFARMLTFKYRRRLVLKSPAHTARLPILLELFPHARFVHITRDPYRVFQSTMHLCRTWQQQLASLQDPSGTDIEALVLGLYEEMHRSFFAHEHRLQPGRYSMVRFEDLERDAPAELERVYRELGLADPPLGRWRRHLASLRGYAKNDYPALAPAHRALVAERWAASFAAWGYPA